MIKPRHLIAISCVGMLLTACSDKSTNAIPETANAVENISTSTSEELPEKSQSDRIVCGGEVGLERWGIGVYSTYKALLRGESSSISATTLARQLTDLTMIATSVESEDGSKTINDASSDIRLAITKMIQDADRKAQHFTDAADRRFTPDNDVTDAMTSYTNALVACTTAGYQPSWFNLSELTGK